MRVDLRWGSEIPQKIRKRTMRATLWILNTDATLRETATRFGVSHSTICRDIHKYLPRLSPRRYRDIINILKRHRHRRSK